MPAALERSGQQRRLANERIAAHQQQQQQAAHGQQAQQREDGDRIAHPDHDQPREAGGHEENPM